MSKTITELKTAAALIKNETQAGKNTANRVGTMFEDIIDASCLDTTSIKADIDALNAEVFPLVVGWGSNNAGTREVGTSITPTATATATRKGADVSSTATMTCTNGSVSGLTATAASQNSGSLTMAATITQGGQSKTTSTLTWTWTYYRYKGEVSEVPTDYATAIAALPKELSTNPTLGSTALAADKYYLFAVKGNATLVCRHASTDGVIGGCVTGTTTISLVNGTGSETYSYILVPKSSSNWSFKITNS